MDRRREYCYSGSSIVFFLSFFLFFLSFFFLRLKPKDLEFNICDLVFQRLLILLFKRAQNNELQARKAVKFRGCYIQRYNSENSDPMKVTCLKKLMLDAKKMSRTSNYSLQRSPPQGAYQPKEMSKQSAKNTIQYNILYFISNLRQQD